MNLSVEFKWEQEQNLSIAPGEFKNISKDIEISWICPIKSV